MRLLAAALVALAPLAAQIPSCEERQSVVNRGDVMANPRVHFVFWGSYWHTTEGIEKADALVQAFAHVSPTYFTGLSQYGVETPKLVGMTVIAPPKSLSASFSSVMQLAGLGFKSPLEPPSLVTEGALVSMLQAQMQAGVFRPPHEVSRSVYFLVFIPPGSATILAGSEREGLHSYWWLPDIGSYVWYGIVTTTNAVSANIEMMLHEMVEGMTDPQGMGVQGPPTYVSWNEIVDLCWRRTSLLDGISVPAYWSQKDRACIVPQPQPINP